MSHRFEEEPLKPTPPSQKWTERARELINELCSADNDCSTDVETLASALSTAHQQGREAGLEEGAQIAERYRSPYTLKASENAFSAEEIHMQEYVRKEIATAIRGLLREE